MRIEMGTTLVIEASAASTEQAASAIEAAFAAASRVIRRLDPARPESDLWRINAAADAAAVPISADSFEVLRFAQRLHRSSGGLFDPCLPTRPGTLADLELIGGAQLQAIAHRPLEIDCGGIAKGYVVDVAIGVLGQARCRAGLVNAGGDVRAFGAPHELLLRAPAGRFRPVRLEDAALAVSERAARRAPAGHRGYYVRSGVAAARRYAAVRAPAAMTADALTKCLLLGPWALTRSLLGEFGAERLA
jgi:thiamine biosynthesis lipoprotein